MKKLLLLLLLSFGFIGSANADAVCNDGWISESTGSGTCSWHGGVYQWLPNGWCSRDCDCSAKKIAALANPKYYGMTYSSALQGCMEGQAQGNLLKILFSNSNPSKPKVPSNAYSSGNSWRCNSGYKKAGNRCQKIYAPANAYVSGSSWKCKSGFRKAGNRCNKVFVANFYDGADAYKRGDYITAIKHWEPLANRGNAEAQFNIGRMYEKGINFKQSDYWAHYWINKAAQLGLPVAEYTLGYFYRNGVGVVKDSTQTVKWFKKAGKKGHAKAQFNLGAMYINGDNVVKSLKDAKYWINLAMDNNHPRAETIWNDFELWKY